MLNSGHFENVSEFLESCITTIKKNSPRFSNLQLAKRLGIPNSTFDRICKQEVKRPSFNHALKIVQEVCENGMVQDFIKKFYPSMYQDFESVYPGNKDVPFVTPEAEIFFQDSSTYEIMLLATCNNGLTREKTLEEFGKKGIAILEKLLQNGILNENDGHIGISGKINAKQDTVHKLVQNLIQNNYDIEAFGDHRNWLSLQYESVNLEVVAPKVREILIEANQKIRDVMNAPESQGNEVVWASLVFDRLAMHHPPISAESDKKVLQ